MVNVSIDVGKVQTNPGENPHFWGKTGSGHKFHKIAVDLDRAWAVCRLTHYERRVLQYVREHTWGVSAPRGKDAEPCVVSAPRLALLWRVHRQRINDAVASLRRDGLLIQLSGRFLIGKDVSAWRGDRITPADIEYAIHGDDPNRDLEPVEPERKCVRPDTRIRPDDTPIRPKRTRIRVERHANPSKADANPCQGGRESVSRPSALYRNPGASEDLEIEEEKTTEGVVGIKRIWDAEADTYVVVPAARHDAEPEPFIPAVVPLPPRIHAPTDDERLQEWARNLALKASGDEKVSEDISRGVPYWRANGFDRHVIAAFVSEAFAIRMGDAEGKVRPHKIPVYIHSALNKYQPGKALPPVPPEWKPNRTAPNAYQSVPERKAYWREINSRPRKMAADRPGRIVCRSSSAADREVAS